MLRELAIENLAVIENACARFCGQMNVFTGETGAGKSVLIGGVNAILGQRVNRGVVRAGAEKAVITALFDELSQGVREKLGELGFEAEDELVLSREIFSDGKSVARINGRTAAASALREIGGLLVDIHGQQDNRILMSNDNQRDILDKYAGIGELCGSYRELFREFTAVSKELKRLTDEAEMREFKTEKLKTAIEELSPLELTRGEGETLEKKLTEARQSAKNAELLGGAYNLLTTDEGNAAAELLKMAEDLLSKIEGENPRAAELAARISAAASEVSDVADEIYSLFDDSAEAQEAALSDKMSRLRTLERKYNMDADGLCSYLEQCEAELSELSGADGRIAELSDKKRSLAEKIKKLAGEISEKRKSAAKKLSDEIKAELSFLDMAGVRIFFELTTEKITINGMDGVELMISANEGEEPKPLCKTASGGELSRIMLAIKSVLADIDDMPTLIFDEIDSGISGRAAQKVGVKLKGLSEKRQVMCITHLAQIASKSDKHFMLEKTNENGRTFTSVSELDFEGRKRELARIIDGSGIESSLAAAEEMLKTTDKSG